MKYNQPYGISDPNAPYINGNPSTGTMGSIPPAASIEHPQREIVALIQSSGLAPSDAVLNQLASGTQSQAMNFAQDVGTVNSVQVTLSPVPILRDGLIVRVRIAQNNTGPAVINVNALGARPIRRKGNIPILANDLVQHSLSELMFNQLLNIFELLGVGGAGARGELTGDKHLYVNFAIGNDANDGTANDAAHAVKYIQRAINIAFGYNPSQYTVYIHIAESQNYIGWATPQFSGPNIVMIGSGAAPANVLVHGGQDHACYVTGINTIHIQNIKVITNPSGTPGPAGGFIASGYSTMTCTQCESGNIDGGVFEATNAQININNHTFAAGSQVGICMWAMNGGVVAANAGAVFNIPGALTCDTFAYAAYGALTTVSPGGILFQGAGIGSVVGRKWGADTNAIVSSLGGGINYFPGNIAGNATLGGQYQ